MKRIILALLFTLCGIAHAASVPPFSPTISPSTNGAYRIGSQDMEFCDDFMRPNTAAGVVSPPLYGPAWSVYGPNLTGASNIVQLRNNAVTIADGSNLAAQNAFYILQQFPYQVNHISAKFGFRAGPGADTGGNVATLAIPLNATTTVIVIHIDIGKNSFLITYYTAGGQTVQKSVTFPTALFPDTTYSADIVLDGPLIRYNIAGLVGVVYSPAIANYGLGPYAFWEAYFNTSTPAEIPYFTSVCAGSRIVGVSQLRDLAAASWRFEDTNYKGATNQGYTLTPTNTPTIGAGLVKSGVHLTRASSQYLTDSVANDVALGLRLAGKDWTVTGWFKLDTLTGTPYYPIVSKSGGASIQEYDLYVDPSTSKFICSASSNGTTHSTAAPTGTLTTGTWYFFACGYDAINGAIAASINNGTQAGAVLTGLYAGSSSFNIGYSAYLNAVHSGSYFDGTIDEVTIFESEPGHGGYIMNRPDRLADLYNAGAGVSYPFGADNPLQGGVSCAAGTVTLLTAVFENGLIKHC